MTANMKVVRDWTPRRLPGGFYCSPACGGSKGFCKQSDHDKAVAASDKLAAHLGDGWTPRIWENLGWHWEVINGPAATDGRFDAGGVIVGFSYGKYRAEFRSALTGTNCVTQFFADADTAEDAIGQVRQDVRTFISRLEADLAASI